MRVGPALRKKSGPFLVPARSVLLVFGLLAVGLGALNLWGEFQAGFIDRNIAITRAVIVVIWLAAIILAFAGFRLGVFIAGLIAFAAFGVTASTHFEAGTSTLGDFVKSQGLQFGTVDMALLIACVMVVISAAVSWSHPDGRNRRLGTLPLLVAALAGAILVVLQATDDIHRTDFGSATPEDGAFAAAVLAALWLAGGFWIARVRRTGALLIALATFGVWYSFVTLHVLKGGTTVSEIAAKSGWFWALVAAAAAILAAASFLLAIGLLIWSFVSRKRPDAYASGTRLPSGAYR